MARIDDKPMRSSRIHRLALLRWASFVSAFAFLLFATTIYAAPQASGYRVVRRIPVGGEGGWDYLSVDPDAHRIYISRGNHMMVIDEDSGKVIADLSNTSGIHRVALAPDLGKGFTSNGQSNTVTFFDLKTLRPISEVKVSGEDPDSIIYDPQTKRLFTFNVRTNNATAIDARNGQVIGTISLGGRPGEPVLDGKGYMFVNLEDKGAMVAFDTQSLAMKSGPWTLAPCEEPSALSMDTAHRRLFAACDKVMVVVDADTGKIIASPPIGRSPDGNSFDPASGLIFCSSPEGLISIVHQDSPDKYSVLGNVPTQFGASTMALDPKNHHVFTMTADFKQDTEGNPNNPNPRQHPVPGSFVILDVAPTAQADGNRDKDNYGVVRVFYATDRKNTGLKQPDATYGGDRSDDGSLSLGTLDVSIPRDHRMGVIERPSIWRLEFREDPNKHLVLLSVAPKRETAFFNELSMKVTTSSHKEAFVFVHGYSVTFAEAARRTAQLAYDLGFDGAPILYSWPSRGSLRDYPADVETIEWTAPHLKTFLDKIASDSHATTVHLIAHSMGNRALAAALNAIAAEHHSIPPLFKQVFLAAPDIDAGVFRQLAQAFPSAAGHVTLYASSRDEALIASQKFNKNPRAGDTGKVITVVPGVDTIDATAVDTGLVGHSYYGDNRSILSDIFYVMQKGDPPDKRFGMHIIKRSGLNYWVFRP